ncbi:TPA: hypothetical protein ACS26J_005147 [Serratia marcescens]
MKGLVLDVGFLRPLLVWRSYWIDEGYVMSEFKGTPGPLYSFAVLHYGQWPWFSLSNPGGRNERTTVRRN